MQWLLLLITIHPPPSVVISQYARNDALNPYGCIVYTPLVVDPSALKESQSSGKGLFCRFTIQTKILDIIDKDHFMICDLSNVQ